MTGSDPNQVSCAAKKEFRKLVQEALALLEAHSNRLEQVFQVENEEHASDIAWTLIDRGMHFAIDNLRSMCVIVQAGYALQSAILCRSLYEKGVHLRWASLAPDGWKRLQADGALQARKWAAEVLSENENGRLITYTKHANAISKVSEPFKVWWDTWKKHQRDKVKLSRNPLPDMPPMLKEIHEIEVAAGRVDPDSEQWIVHYNVYYRQLSMMIHGHPLQIRDFPRDTLVSFQSIILGDAVQAICLACLNFRNPETQEEWDTIEAQMSHFSTLAESVFVSVDKLVTDHESSK